MLNPRVLLVQYRRTRDEFWNGAESLGMRLVAWNAKQVNKKRA